MKIMKIVLWDNFQTIASPQISVDQYVDEVMADHELGDEEIETCRLLLAGHQPKEMVSLAGVTYGVMKHRIAAVYRKFNVRDYRQLFAKFLPIVEEAAQKVVNE